MVDVLCGVLSGANWGRSRAVRSPPGNSKAQRRPWNRTFLWGPANRRFHRPDSFKRQIDDYIRVFRATKPAPGTKGPLLPGDPEREAEKWRRKNGVPLILPVVEELRDIAKKTGIPFE